MSSLQNDTVTDCPGLDAVEILDCTLRDGSYAVNFQFTESTISKVLKGLEAAGIRLIELGHGLGLNAAEALAKPSSVSDEQCFEIAVDSLAKANWGMFCIPGIAKLTHLRNAAAAGMGFVRVGVEITDVSPAREFIELSKELGLRSFANLMKTNVLGIDGVAEAAKQCQKFGAEGVYLVDSVGGFLPSEVDALFRYVSRYVSVPLGFHGHDNLGLANANALAAANAGAQYVDATLDGIGRGAGNTTTEVLGAILWRETTHPRYEYRALSRLSETVIRPLARLRDDRTYQLVGGLTQTHSSFFPLITKCAMAKGVDVFDLMGAVAQRNKVNPSEELITNVASDLVSESYALGSAAFSS